MANESKNLLMVQVPGYGTMKYSMLVTQVQQKIKDLTRFSTDQNWNALQTVLADKATLKVMIDTLAKIEKDLAKKK